ncbi:unnamed protein product, partial [Ectocarpus sp. 12 AP-2014]
MTLQDADSRQEDKARDDNVGGAKGDEGTNEAKQDTEMSVSPGAFFDELLDTSETESPDDSGINSTWKRNGHNRGAEGTGSFLEDDKSSGSCVDGGVDLDGTSRGTCAVLPWIVSRLGLLEQVEGCYESESKAFNKAVEILCALLCRFPRRLPALGVTDSPARDHRVTHHLLTGGKGDG